MALEFFAHYAANDHGGETRVRSSRGNVGLALALLSGATFGTSGSFATSLIASGWTPGAAVTARVLIAAAVLTAPAVARLRSRPAARGAARTIVLYGVAAVAGAQLCYFNAVSHVSVAVALLLEYSGILLVVAWGWVRHGHRPSRLMALSGALALAGLVVVLDLTGSHHVDAAGVLWGLGAGVGLATYFVLSAETDDSMPPLVVAWGGLAVGGLGLAVAGVAGVMPVHASGAAVTLLDRQVPWVVPVLGLSIVAAVIPYLSGIAAARVLGAKLASFVGLIEVLFAVAFAWLLLGQRLDAIQLAGGAMVVLGIAFVRLDEIRGATPRALSATLTPVIDVAAAGDLLVRDVVGAGTPGN
jgi:drug/metabolite transporter (DMT)-like permease